MKVKFSKFGEKLCCNSGILELMDDLGKAMAGREKKLMLGGGNPAAVPAAAKEWRRQMKRLLAKDGGFDKMLCNYDPPQGSPDFIDSIVGFLRDKYGWKLNAENVAITPGSQSAFFALFNLFSGDYSDGKRRKVLFPFAPEYIGYADQAIGSDAYISVPSKIEKIGEHQFKYHADFSRLPRSEEISLMVLSRPTNPTGNVVTNEELHQLSDFAKKEGMFLAIDNAYGDPFPGIIFRKAELIWDEHIILSLSLSKLGLPGLRTGIIVAAPEVIRAISALTAVVSLANCNVGQKLLTPLLSSGKISQFCREKLKPYYLERREFAENVVDRVFDQSLPYRFHLCEGAMFFWLWCEGLPISDRELYQRLKERNVIVVPGSYFFFGLQEPWNHSSECIRINYTQPTQVVEEGLKVVAEEVARAYGS